MINKCFILFIRLFFLFVLFSGRGQELFETGFSLELLLSLLQPPECWAAGATAPALEYMFCSCWGSAL
jgi:hypothetical protein